LHAYGFAVAARRRQHHRRIDLNGRNTLREHESRGWLA
jgi:hypothetical protein